jgi:hypothetical protein
MPIRTILYVVGAVVAAIILHFLLGDKPKQAVHKTRSYAAQPLPAQSPTIETPPVPKKTEKKTVPKTQKVPQQPAATKPVTAKQPVSSAPVSGKVAGISKLRRKVITFLRVFYSFPEGDVEETHCAALNQVISLASDAVKADVCFQTDKTRAQIYTDSSTNTYSAASVTQTDQLEVNRLRSDTAEVLVPVEITISNNGKALKTLTKKTTSTWQSVNGSWTLLTYRES